ncbi:MAG: hypothetical protein HFI60_00500 [Lachnospiraceae bacterium]|jgi:hypothetical protein|nr:hypothetical protein [Lachnospiraceae bacterium]
MNNIIDRAVKKVKILAGIDTDWSEHKKSFGDLNPDKTFYVIRRGDRLAGVNSHFISNMGHIRYALRNGWIPIVDMQNYPNALLDEDDRGRQNAWEYYFKQPCEYSLDEIYQSKNVILSEGVPPRIYPNDSMEFLTRQKWMRMWHKYYEKYVGFSEELQDQIDKRYVQYLQSKKSDRILGVFLRGTDYLLTKPYEHPVQPSIEEAVQKSMEVMEQQKCKWIFLVTEDQHILDAFIKSFADKLIYVKEQARYSKMSAGECIAEHSFHREHDNYLKGMECMVQVGLLLQCNCLISGRTSGCVAVMVMQPEYDYTYFWNLGRYGIDDVIDEI